MGTTGIGTGFFWYHHTVFHFRLHFALQRKHSRTGDGRAFSPIFTIWVLSVIVIALGKKMCLLPPCPLWFIHILNNLTILATIKHLQVMAILRLAIPHFPWCLMIHWWSTIILPARWVKTCYDQNPSSSYLGYHLGPWRTDPTTVTWCVQTLRSKLPMSDSPISIHAENSQKWYPLVN